MIESFSKTIMKYGFIRKFCRLLYHTLVQELRLHSLVFVALFWNPFFVTQCKKSIEFWNNRCILGICLDRFDRPRHARMVSI